MGGDLRGPGTRPEIGDQLIEALGCLGAHVAVVDLHARGPVAAGQALGLFEGDGPVGGGAPGVDPEGRLGMLEELHGPIEQTGDVGAHRHQVAAHRLGVQHVVERRRPQHLGRGQIEQGGDVDHDLGRQPTLLFLGQMAQGYERRPRLGIEGDQLPGAGGGSTSQMGEGGSRSPLGAGAGYRGGVGGAAHRSTSPITGSTEEHTDTASANRPPRIITGRAWRFTKLGPRMCIR